MLFFIPLSITLKTKNYAPANSRPSPTTIIARTPAINCRSPICLRKKSPPPLPRPRPLSLRSSVNPMTMTSPAYAIPSIRSSSTSHTMMSRQSPVCFAIISSDSLNQQSPMPRDGTKTSRGPTNLPRTQQSQTTPHQLYAHAARPTMLDGSEITSHLTPPSALPQNSSAMPSRKYGTRTSRTSAPSTRTSPPKNSSTTSMTTVVASTQVK